jgi:pantothenate kinase
VTPRELAAELAADLLARSAGRPRYLVALAGPPGAGKSSLAEALLAECDAAAPGRAALVPMDGYHYDNAVLDERGLRARKGAPATFDVDALARDLERIRQGREVAVPVFDRGLDLARASARLVGPERSLVIVEGNYLLLDAAPWSDLSSVFDRTLLLTADLETLRRRLVRRWLDHGHDPDAAAARAEDNDLANARLVLAQSRAPDLLLRS